MTISPPLKTAVALVIGFALAYLVGLAVAAEVAVLQLIHTAASVRESPSLSAALVHLSQLSLSSLALTYLLGRLLFRVVARARPIDAVAFLLPLALQGLWFEYVVNSGSIQLAISSLFAMPIQVLSWLSILLVTLLALTQARRASVA